jgi:hypothetical protein
MLKGAEERMKNAEERLRSFIERPDPQYSSEEKAENKRLLDVLPGSDGGVFGSI